jgi:hypothetical protein
MGATDGQYALQYWGKRGWWTGHHGMDLPDPEAYVKGVNELPGFHCRLIDKHSGEIIGDQRTCTECGVPHDGFDGACLI